MLTKETYKQYYSRIKPLRRVISENDFTYINIVSVLKKHLKDGLRVLDIGCGVGSLDFYIAHSVNANVYGVDYSEQAIRMAQINSKILGLTARTNYYVTDFPKSSIKGRYDLIILSEVLEHLKNDKLALMKIYCLMRPGGLLFISVPLSNAPLYRMGVLHNFDEKVGHLRRYDYKGLISLLNDCNFKVIESCYAEGLLRNLLFTNYYLGSLIRFIKPPFSILVNYVDYLLGKLMGFSQLIIVLRK